MPGALVCLRFIEGFCRSAILFRRRERQGRRWRQKISGLEESGGMNVWQPELSGLGQRPSTASGG